MGPLLMPRTSGGTENGSDRRPVGVIGHRMGMTTIAGRYESAAASWAVAVGSVAALAAVAVVALRTGAGQRLDEWARTTVVAGGEAEVTVLSLLGRISIGAVLAVAVTCVVLAVVRGQIRLAVSALVVIVGANITTQLLKRVVLERTAFDVIVPNSLPSGHTTAVASAVGALLLVVPRALRLPVVVAGAFAATVTGASTIVAGWHRPADIAAALAVCLGWTAASSLAVGGSRRSVPGVGAGSLAGAGGALLLLVAMGVRPAYGWSGFAEATVVLGAMALATAFTVAVMERISPTVAER